MIHIGVAITSTDGKQTDGGGFTIDQSEKVHAVEVTYLWESIREGRFERHAKGMLEKLCADHGLNAGELLR